MVNRYGGAQSKKLEIRHTTHNADMMNLWHLILPAASTILYSLSPIIEI